MMVVLEVCDFGKSRNGRLSGQYKRMTLGEVVATIAADKKD